MPQTPIDIVLASASPRRAELLTAAGFAFVVVPADVDETPWPNEPPSDYARRVARAKAEHVVRLQSDDRVVLAADTVVVGGGRLMGKPKGRDDAEAMLRILSGAVHEVLTAVVVRKGTRQAERLTTTRVQVQPLSDPEIAWYLESGEPFGKAGAYGIQGLAARFIDHIEGSWSNVVGLPISTVYRLLRELRESEEERLTLP
jgi:nucleoside triphosphate pyrophosphatase